MNNAEIDRVTRFINLLDKMGWSQSEAGRKLGTTSNYINMIVRGKAAPSESLVKHFETKVDSANVFGGPYVLEFSKLFKNVPAESQGQVFEVVKAVVNSHIGTPETRVYKTEHRELNKSRN